MSLLDKLPKFLSPKHPKEHFEYYFGLDIQSKQVVGCVWGIEGNKMQILSTAKRGYESLEELTESANYALDEALADFQPEPTKILFGVPDDWLLDEDLKPEYLKVLRQMVKELDVTPMAYVSSTHAICHLLQKQQGVPVTAVLVNIADPLQVSVVKGGKVLGTKGLKRSESLPQDIERALMTFADVEVLPSKILIYGAAELDKFKEELLSFGWMAQLPFLHLPKIDQLDSNIEIKAVSFAGGSEINPDVSLSHSELAIGQEEKHSKISRPLVAEEHNNLRAGRKDLEDLGFVSGDIEELKKPEGPVRREETAFADDDYGVEEASGEMDVYKGRGMEMGHHSSAMNYPHPQRGLKDKLLAPFGVLSGFSLSGLGGGFRFASSGLKVFLIPVILIAFLVGAFLYFQKATVTIFVDLKTLENEATVTADPTVTAVDEANKKIPGKEVSTDVSGSGKGTATGKKQIGEAAKGTVVLYNKTSASKSFAQGTILVGPESLNFILDSTVNVASQSAVEGGISFGKANANVTASQIGPEGNLAAGKELSIKGQDSSSYSAKVDTAFSGGVSKDVTVVTSDDQKKLLAQVSSELRNKAKDEIQGKLTGDTKVLSEGLTEKITKQAFSKNVGDQANEFSLNLTARYKGTSYSDGDLKLIVSKLVEINVPDGYVLDLSKTETQSDVSKIEKDGKLIFLAKFKAKLMPKLDQEQLKKMVAGKTPSQVSEIVKGFENVIGSTIQSRPSLPGPFQRLPFLVKNITIEVTAK